MSTYPSAATARLAPGRQLLLVIVGLILPLGLLAAGCGQDPQAREGEG